MYMMTQKELFLTFIGNKEQWEQLQNNDEAGEYLAFLQQRRAKETDAEVIKIIDAQIEEIGGN